MSKVSNLKQYDLEDRTFSFSHAVIQYCKLLSCSIHHTEITRQLIRSAGSVGANYIEANESFSKKDFILRIKICRKEAKESRYWIKLTEPPSRNIGIKSSLIQEATELTKIFGSIVVKSE